MTQTAQPAPAAPPDDVVPGQEIYTPEFRADPYPVYARLRAERPVVKVRTPRFDSFLVTRYADARQALSDPRLSKDLYRADRKSTRLNSSHANISYAVFCLKKKNQAHHVRHRPG